MECYQLDFFRSEEESEILAMNEKIKAIDASTHRVRKSLFAKNGELTKKVNDLESRLQILERHICRPEKIELNFTI